MAPTSRVRRRPLVIFVLAVLVPGLALAALGIRTLQQDRQLVDQQIRERLDAAAGRASSGLTRTLRQLDDAVAEVQAGPSQDLAPLPVLIRDALATSSGAVLILRDAAGSRMRPEGALLYAIPDLIEPPLRGEVRQSPAWLEAEALEFQRRDLTAAIRAYGALAASASASADGDLRARALAAQARTLRKAGRMAEARDTYARLGRQPGAWVGAVPAGLVALDARCELDEAASDLRGLASCGLDLYRSLVDGRWLLEKARFTFYAERAKTWVASAGAPPPQLGELAALESRKAALTGAVEAFAVSDSARGASSGSDPDRRPAAGRRVLPVAGGAAVAWWRPGTDAMPAVTLVLAAPCAATLVWARALADARDPDLRLSLVAPDGAVLFASDPGAATPPPVSALVAIRDVQEGSLRWQIRVWPRDPDRLYAALRTRQRLYAAMLALMVVSLAAGVLLTARTLKREMDVAERESRFVSAVSHEFRSPLAGIRQLSDMLVRERVPDEARRQQYYLQIRRESDRLARLVEHVLDVARIKDGRAEYHLEPIDTTAWLRDVVADFQQMREADGGEVVARIPDALPAIRADRQALTTAVHNLLDNAVKYSPGRRAVWLDAEAVGGTGGKTDGGQVMIRVRDEGVGIPPDEQPRVFDRFFRGSRLADEVKGTGLGLSLVWHIVSAHGGRVELASAPGEGSTFTIALPEWGSRDSAAFAKATAPRGFGVRDSES